MQMTAKEYLEQIMLLDVMTSHRVEEKESLPDGFTDLHKTISEAIDRLVNKKNKIIGKILLLHDPLQSEAVFLRYIRSMKQRYWN